MGNNILRKVLIMTFEDKYLYKLSQILLKKSIEIQQDLGFTNHEDKEKNILYTFLSSKVKRTWIHHFTGTYGIVLILEGEGTDRNITEIDNLFKCPALRKIPILVVLDKEKFGNKGFEYIEKIRESFQDKDFLVFFQYVNFNADYASNELNYGLNWLEMEMLKSIGN